MRLTERFNDEETVFSNGQTMENHTHNCAACGKVLTCNINTNVDCGYPICDECEHA